MSWRRFRQWLSRGQAEQRRIHISAPLNFEHKIHVEYDHRLGCYVGLPPQWQAILQNDARKNNRARRLSCPSSFSRRDQGLNGKLPHMEEDKLGKPRMRVSIADEQDLIIERLKREYREFKETKEDERTDDFMDERPAAMKKELKRIISTSWTPSSNSSISSEHSSHIHSLV